MKSRRIDGNQSSDLHRWNPLIKPIQKQSSQTYNNLDKHKFSTLKSKLNLLPVCNFELECCAKTFQMFNQSDFIKLLHKHQFKQIDPFVSIQQLCKQSVQLVNSIGLVGIITQSSKAIRYADSLLFQLSQNQAIIIGLGSSCLLYYGGWKDNQYQGWGYQHLRNGSIYRGQFKLGLKHGYGINFTPQNIWYQGNWYHNLKSGLGQLYCELFQYCGSWRDGDKNGNGFIKSKTGQSYEGQFKQDLKHGTGFQTFQNGDQYKGQYAKDLFNGVGQYIWKDKTSYQGCFANGLKQGYGEWQGAQKGSYKGQYSNNLKHGIGIYFYPDGSEYQGQFLNGLRHGIGVIKYKTGKVARFRWNQGQIVQKLYSQLEEEYRQRSIKCSQLKQNQNNE